MPAYHARISLEAHQTTTNALIVNVLHAEVDTLSSPPNWGSIATDVAAWLAQLWANCLTTNDHVDQIVVTDENYPGSTHGQGVAALNLGGARTLADSKLDPAVCMVGTWKTAVAKRYARGHIFYPPAIDSAAWQGGGLANQSNAYFQAVLAFGNAYVAGHTAGSTSYVPEVFSKHLVTLGQTPFSNKILGHGLDTHMHFLRSRSTAP